MKFTFSNFVLGSFLDALIYYWVVNLWFLHTSLLTVWIGTLILNTLLLLNDFIIEDSEYKGIRPIFKKVMLFIFMISAIAQCFVWAGDLTKPIL